MSVRFSPFACATLIPAALIISGAAFGGVFVLLAVLYLTAVTSLLDWLGHSGGDRTEGTLLLPVCIAICHFVLLPVVIWALAAPHLEPTEKLGLFFATGLWLGQVSNANAHELIHRSSRALHRLGMWCYITLLFGHHTSAHVLVHHRYVGTAADPNTSKKGESLYRYIWRAWTGSFREGFAAEGARLTKIKRGSWHNPYIVYVGGAALFIAATYVIFGWQGALAYVVLCLHAQSQLLMSDYVQHYGLKRAMDAHGRPEPVSTKHSWNSPHWFSSTLLLNATRHSDHHAHPAKAYPELSLAPDAPMLPKPLPLMASIALIPPLWRRMMDPRVEAWQNA